MLAKEILATEKYAHTRDTHTHTTAHKHNHTNLELITVLQVLL